MEREECGRCRAIQAMNRMNELVGLLHVLLLQQRPDVDLQQQVSAGVSDDGLLEEIRRLNSSTLSKLQSIACRCSSCDDFGGTPIQVGAPGQKIRRRKQETWSVATSVPYNDGYLWRKYGQKTIHNAKYQRSYHRCIHSKKGCLAKKTIQLADVSADHPPIFTVEYISRHTCKSIGDTPPPATSPPPLVMESAPAAAPGLQPTTFATPTCSSSAVSGSLISPSLVVEAAAPGLRQDELAIDEFMLKLDQQLMLSTAATEMATVDEMDLLFSEMMMMMDMI